VAPHWTQNFMPGFHGAPQTGHAADGAGGPASMGAPHAVQNRIPAGSSRPQPGHRIFRCLHPAAPRRRQRIYTDFIV
jgi:hypothetical protein